MLSATQNQNTTLPGHFKHNTLNPITKIRLSQKHKQIFQLTVLQHNIPLETGLRIAATIVVTLRFAWGGRP